MAGFSAALNPTGTAFTTTAKAPRSVARRVTCAAMPEMDRRAMLAGIAGALAAAPLLEAGPAEAKLVDRTLKASSLSSFQRKDVVEAFQRRAEGELRKVLTAADAPTALRLLLNDAATYDAASGTGGVNGSVVMSEELSRPENKDLKALVARLATAKKASDDARPDGQKPLSWADALVLAVKITQQEAWAAAKLAKNPINGEKLVAQFSNPFPVRLGRVDATAPDPPGRLPVSGASPSEVLAFMSRLGVKDPAALEGPFGKKPPFWERPTFVIWTAAQPDPEAAEAAFVAAAPEQFAAWKSKYDKSKSTTFRQDYEIDFIDYVGRLASMGATFDNSAYLYDIVVKVPDRL